MALQTAFSGDQGNHENLKRFCLTKTQAIRFRKQGSLFQKPLFLLFPEFRKTSASLEVRLVLKPKAKLNDSTWISNWDPQQKTAI